jgi:hypothetical protein
VIHTGKKRNLGYSEILLINGSRENRLAQQKHVVVEIDAVGDFVD